MNLVVRFIVILHRDNFLIVDYLLYYETVSEKEEPKMFTEKATERTDENGVKYIVYEENNVDIDEDAEVNICFSIKFYQLMKSLIVILNI